MSETTNEITNNDSNEITNEITTNNNFTDDIVICGDNDSGCRGDNCSDCSDNSIDDDVSTEFVLPMNEEQITKEVDNLHQSLICPICTQKFYNPVTLICQHTFCKECLVMMNERKCAICRVGFIIPKEHNRIIEDAVKVFFREEWEERDEEFKAEHHREDIEKEVREEIRRELFNEVVTGVMQEFEEEALQRRSQQRNQQRDLERLRRGPPPNNPLQTVAENPDVVGAIRALGAINNIDNAEDAEHFIMNTVDRLINLREVYSNPVHIIDIFKKFAGWTSAVFMFVGLLSMIPFGDTISGYTSGLTAATHLIMIFVSGFVWYACGIFHRHLKRNERVETVAPGTGLFPNRLRSPPTVVLDNNLQQQISAAVQQNPGQSLIFPITFEQFAANTQPYLSNNLRMRHQAMMRQQPQQQPQGPQQQPQGPQFAPSPQLQQLFNGQSQIIPPPVLNTGTQ